MSFLPVERSIVMLIATLAVLSGILITLKGVSIDIIGYGGIVASGMLTMGLGQYYRTLRPNPRIADTLTATALFILFSMIASVFNYMLLPVRFPVIDPFLTRLDAALGFHWPSFVTWVSYYPFFATLLRVVYFTSLLQMLVIILILGFSAQLAALHRFLMTGIFAAMITIVYWSFFPSFGASAVHSLPQTLLDAMPIAVGPAYSAEVVRIAHEGVNDLSPANALGLIGFPSFHTVMACMSVCFARKTGRPFLLFVLLNLVMVPAIVIQGGHHLMDLFGGVAAFLAAYALSGSVVSKSNATIRGMVERPQM